MDKVVDFITSSVPGVPAVSGAGATGAYIQDKYHPEEILR
ncbi:hypothetical protein [uncultured Gammaproteobacteria bacterium]|jgi:hypothetical protein|uniref:Uncharacterized protein n=1 Tax=Bathymodiolus thermophilus thioautotrophic gill symbiont TaxID=2360 RepID=A0ABM8M9N5_9GAMM|nr:hypothetical protein AZO1586I_1762 [Bathymodiolus thermophilus thioautotrophic gill symbiont]CAC9509912.1 hypothetical protein [uncultured Gammaproteobacteria bacterium]CAC9982059.1 hypothetical protein [uncultured Gammaproteobacteria bacterium]VVH55843.1 hypothetical protein BAZOLSSOX_1042 [uncultured Gammaproteobacteria bacterium]